MAGSRVEGGGGGVGHAYYALLHQSQLLKGDTRTHIHAHAHAGKILQVCSTCLFNKTLFITRASLPVEFVLQFSILSLKVFQFAGFSV